MNEQVMIERVGRSSSELLDPDAVHYGANELAVETHFATILRDYWSAILKNRVMVIAIVLSALVLGIAATLLMTPIYRATSTVQIDREASRVLSTADDNIEPVAEAQESDQFMATQLDILKSRSLRIRALQALGLLRGDSFFEKMHVKINTDDMTPEEADATRKEAALKVLANNLQIASTRDSRVVEVGFDSPDPILSARIANSVANNYISGNLERRFDSTSYARDFLQRQLALTKAKLEDSERQMIAYARKEQLIDASDGDSSNEPRGPKSLTTASLVQLNSAYSDARAGRLTAQERWAQAQGSSVFDLPEVLDNKLIQDLLSRRSDLQGTYQQQRKLFKEDYPTMRQQSAQIADLTTQINREAGNVRKSIKEQYDVAAKQEGALAGDVSRLKAATLDEQGRSVQYNILKRESDTNKALYDGLLQRYKEVGVAAGVTANNISIVDVADPPLQPIRPRPLINLLLSLLLGSGLAVFAAIGKEHFDDAINAPEDVNRKLGLPLLGAVPKTAKGTLPREELRRNASPLSEAYYSIRGALQYSTSHGAPRTILVTSSRQSEGKSTSALAISLDFAKIGKSVLLIDGDMRKPSIHKLLSMSGKVGFSSVLTSEATLGEAVQTTPVEGFNVLTCGPQPLNPADLLASPLMNRLLAEAMAHYDLVVIDGPPVLGLADAPLLAGMVEGTVIVIEASRAYRGNAKAAIRRLISSQAHLIGVILTKFDAKRSGYGSDYAYSYSYNYGGGDALESA